MKKNLKKGISMVMACLLVSGAVAGVAPVVNETQVYASTYTLDDLIIANFSDGYSLHAASVFSEGLIFAKNSSENKYAFLDKTGNVVLEVDFNDTTYDAYDTDVMFVGGLAPFFQDGKAGFINKQGEVVIPLSYDAVRNFSEGLAAVKKDDKWGFIDTTGTEIIPCIYTRVEDFSEDLAVVRTRDEDWNYICNYVDKSGNIAIYGEEYNDIGSFSEGLAAVYTGEYNTDSYRINFIDKTGNIKFSTNTQGRIYNEFSENRAFLLYSTGKDIDIIDSEGNIIKKLQDYGTDGMYINDYIYSEGLMVYFLEINHYGDDAHLSQHGTGYIDLNGDIVVLSDGYSRVRRFSEGVAIINDSCIIKNPLTEGATSTEEVKNEEVIIPEEITPEEVVIPEEITTEEITTEEVILTEEVVTTPSLVASENNDISTAKNSSIIMINGNKVDFQAYNIDGNNYFKLRDIAEVLKGTEKQFEVIWNNESNATHLIRNSAYTTVGGELENTGSIGNMQSKISTIYVDDTPTELQSYNIDGNEYFKLRDLGELVDFAIGWDYKSKVVNVNTDSSYSN